MNLINPFNNSKNGRQEAKAIQEDRQYQRDAEVTASGVHPQDMDYEQLVQREGMMAELTRWQQDLGEMQRELFVNLAGLIEDDDGKLVPVPDFQPLCNQIGAKRFVDTIKPLDKNAMNGAWTIKQINDTMIAIDDMNRQDIKEHWRYYNIQYSPAVFNRICETIINGVYPTLLRGLDNGERKFHGQIQKTIETKNILPDQKRPGLFGKI